MQQTQLNLGEISFIMNFYLMTCLLPIRATAGCFDSRIHDLIKIKNGSNFLVDSTAGFSLYHRVIELKNLLEMRPWRIAANFCEINAPPSHFHEHLIYFWNKRGRIFDPKRKTPFLGEKTKALSVAYSVTFEIFSNYLLLIRWHEEFSKNPIWFPSAT